MSKKILKDSSIYVIGEMVSKGIPFLLLPYLSKKLGTEGYGLLSYYQTYLALFILGVGLSQDGAIARYFYTYGKKSINLVVRTGYIYTLVVGIIFFFACWLLQSQILMFISVAVIFRVFVGVQLSVRQCQKQALAYTIIQFLLTSIPVVIIILLFEFTQDNLIEKYFIATMLGNILVFLTAYFLYRKQVNTDRKFSFKQHKTALFYLFSFGFPLLFHHASLFIKGQLDRLFIYHKYTESELGVYAMGANIALIVFVLISAINKGIMPHFYEALQKQKITLKNIHLWALYSLLLVPLGLLVLLFIPESLFLWILGDGFVGVKYYFMLFLVSALLILPYLFLANYLFYYGKTQLVATCSVLSTIFYLSALEILVNIDIKYIPYASIIGAVGVLPILFVMTKRVDKKD